MNFTYQIDKSYQENYEQGPQLGGVEVSVPFTDPKDFLGCSVGSRLGIAAGLLLNSKWIEAYAHLGFDLLTYKTVRSSYRPCYPLPNWVFISDDSELEGPVYACSERPVDPRQVTSAVCFGMPSMAPDVWRKDVERAKSVLGAGQALIVSVVATPREGWGAEEIAGDFAVCARWAAESGADMIEANLSCPNVCTAEGSIYLDPRLSQKVAEAVKAACGNLPVLLKVGYFEDRSLMRELLRQTAKHVSGMTMVNGITRPVLHPNGDPVFGKDYVEAGVLGRGIHQASVDSVATAVEIIDQEELDLSLLAVGGAASVADIDDFFNVGADAVLAGSSPMYHPSLAAEAKAYCPQW